MPELPEVETVRRGLAPIMEGAVFSSVELRRPDLRFPLPHKFEKRLAGAGIETLDRRGKYLIATLSTGESLIMHLGMSGRFTISAGRVSQPGRYVQAHDCDPMHDHVVFHVKGRSPALITYNDPRRFGFMDLVSTAALEKSKHFQSMGPEPLGNGFSPLTLNAALKGKAAPIKAALLDQRVVAGLGNIYVCEALYRARISPRRKAASVAGKRGERLYTAIVGVLREAIEAGGSSLRDFASAEGGLGYFQHRFGVYDREGQSCLSCDGMIARLVQGGRSTFFCGQCQR